MPPTQPRSTHAQASRWTSRRANLWANRWVICAVLLALAMVPHWAGRAGAEPPPPDQAILLADRVEIDAQGRLIAQGNVDVMLSGWQLRAPRIVYDPARALLDIDGPLTLRDADGRLQMLADAGQLSDSLRDGLMQGAQMLLHQRLRIRAETLQRSDGQVTEMRPAIASSCRVCSSEAAPLWEIRATEVRHDTETRQIDFWNAQLRLAGLPVLWFPRLRLPDPSLKRAQGFLAPELRSTTALGLGIEAPYFIPLGPSRDLLLRPFLGAEGSAILALRYRQALENGLIEITGTSGLATGSTAANDPGGLRGTLTARGDLALPRGYGLSFSATAVSDRSVLADYAISDSDRVESRAEVRRIGRSGLVQGRLIRRTSLRDVPGEDGRAAFLLDGQWQRRLALPRHWGQAHVSLEGYGIRREREAFAQLLSGLGRLSATGAWRAERIVGNGFVLGAASEVTVDFYRIAPEATPSFTARRALPSAAIDLAWPQIRAAGAAGAYDVLTPRVQIAAGRMATSGQVANADSLTPELDEGNLFDFNRYVGADRREAGPRANLGLGWERFGPDGSVRRLAVGRVLRDSGPADHGGSADEPGIRAEWLLAAGLSDWRGLGVSARGTLDDAQAFERADLRLDYTRGRTGLGALWLWTRGDGAAAEPLQRVDISELSAQLRLGLGPHLNATGTGRYDLTAREPTEAGLRLEYMNECLRVDLSLSRQLSTSTTVGSSTEFGLQVELLGFGGTAERVGPSRRCGPKG